jgi:CHASE3 domain sensor protein
VKFATKKITSLFFILLGFTPLLLSVVFVIKQQSIRHTMKERMEEQMLHAVTLPQPEIIWLKKGK